MARGISVPKKLASLGSSFSPLWIVVVIFLLAIILFAIFFPRKFYKQESFLVPEDFSDYNDLMENMDNDDSIETLQNASDPVMVMFFAPWCGHCQNCKPDFEKFRQTLIQQGGQVKAKLVNCDENKDMAKKYGVQGFPTFKYFPKGMNGGVVREYNGPRTVDGWMSFIKDN